MIDSIGCHAACSSVFDARGVLMLLFGGAVEVTNSGTILLQLYPGSQAGGYQAGKLEMRVYQITLSSAATIPLHTHPSPSWFWLGRLL